MPIEALRVPDGGARITFENRALRVPNRRSSLSLKGMDRGIRQKTVTLDFARRMSNAELLSCEGFAELVSENIGSVAKKSDARR